MLKRMTTEVEVIMTIMLDDNGYGSGSYDHIFGVNDYEGAWYVKLI